MVFAEFSRMEVIDFLRKYDLFSMPSSDRVQILWEAGEIEENDFESAKRQEFNDCLLSFMGYSALLKNSYLEQLIEKIVGVKIKIVDHLDESILGVSCSACNLVVFETKEDFFFEICPVCQWQNDGVQADLYSSANRSTLLEYRELKEFDRAVSIGKLMYIRRESIT